MFKIIFSFLLINKVACFILSLNVFMSKNNNKYNNNKH